MKRLTILTALTMLLCIAMNSFHTEPAYAGSHGSSHGVLDSTPATLVTADSIFKEDYLGPSAISMALGIPLDKIKAPAPPFTVGELVYYKKHGYILVLQIDSIDGKPLTLKHLFELYENKMQPNEKLINTNVSNADHEPFYTVEVPRATWKLVTKEILPGSVKTDYLAQTALLAGYPRDLRLPGCTALDTSAAYIAQMQKADMLLKANKSLQRKGMTQPDTTGLQEASRILAGIDANIQYRETAVEVFYRMILYRTVNGIYLFADNFVWTKSLSMNHQFIGIGNFIKLDPKIMKPDDYDKTGMTIDKRDANTPGPVRGTTFSWLASFE